MIEWPPLLPQIFLRVGEVVLFSLAMVALTRLFRRGSASSSLWPRGRTWVVIAAILLGAAALGPWGLAAVMAGIAWVAQGELSRARPDIAPGLNRMAAMLALAVAAGLPVPVLALAAPLYLIWMARDPSAPRFAAQFAGFGQAVYLVLPLVLLVLLRRREDGFQLVCWIILVVCFNDVMAMFGGLLVGRTPILSKISPSKTFEGMLVGLLGAIGAAALLQFAFPGIAAWRYYAATLTVALAGNAGDLFASAVKRSACVKDFGTILPGHGGVMDRLDSLLFAVPVAWVILQ